MRAYEATDAAIQKKVTKVNDLIAKAVDGDGDKLGAIDYSGTWQAPMYFKPFVLRNGFLWGEYEEYTGMGKNKAHKDRWSKKNMEEGIGWMNDVAKWLRRAIKDYEKEKSKPQIEESMKLPRRLPLLEEMGARSVKESKMTVRELSAAWRKMYGENFITEYSGLYKELKAKGEFTVKDLEEAWDAMYGEKFSSEYSGLHKELKKLYEDSEEHGGREDFEKFFDAVRPEDVLKVRKEKEVYAFDTRGNSDFLLDDSHDDKSVQQMIDSDEFLFGTEKKSN